MDGFQGVLDNFNTSVKNLQNTVNVNAANVNLTSSLIDLKNQNFEVIYNTYSGSNLSNWYKALPYGFLFTPRDGNAITIYLPISPSNISIVTHFSTKVIPTLYGTIEQHSDQRYFDIVIEGTTGISPRYVDILDIEKSNAATLHKTGRQAFSIQESIGSDVLGGFFQKTISTANQILNKTADIFAPQKNLSGVDVQRTGYAAFHNLYKFFLYYKRDTSGQTSTATRNPNAPHPLVFLNYKDNNKYDCSIQKFTLKRDKDNPMLYNYSIILKAYNIQPLDANPAAQFDLAAREHELGLDGINNSSVFSTLKGLSSNAKQIFGAASGGLNILGS